MPCLAPIFLLFYNYEDEDSIRSIENSLAFSFCFGVLLMLLLFFVDWLIHVNLCVHVQYYRNSYQNVRIAKTEYTIICWSVWLKTISQFYWYPEKSIYGRLNDYYNSERSEYRISVVNHFGRCTLNWGAAYLHISAKVNYVLFSYSFGLLCARFCRLYNFWLLLLIYESHSPFKLIANMCYWFFFSLHRTWKYIELIRLCKRFFFLLLLAKFYLLLLHQSNKSWNALYEMVSSG